MFKFKSLSGRLLFWFGLVSVITIFIVGYVNYYYSSNTVLKMEFDKLTTARDIKKEKIINYIDNIFKNLDLNKEIFKSAFSKLKVYHDSGGGEANEDFKTKTKEYEKIYSEIDPLFRKYREIYNYADIYLICSDHGHVMYSTGQGDDLGTNLGVGDYKNTRLAELWKIIVRTKKPAIVDYSNYNGEICFFTGIPLYSSENDLLGVVAVKIKANFMNSIAQQQIEGMGETEETYITGTDLLLRTVPLLAGTEDVILKKTIDTEAARSAAKDMAGTDFIMDYRGKMVLSSYSNMGMNEKFDTDFDWLIINEIDGKEVFEPVKKQRNVTLICGLVLFILIMIMAFFISQSISKPLKIMAKEMIEVGTGNLTAPITVIKSEDEMGVLTREFDNMVSSLRAQSIEIKEGVNVLSSAVSQILAASSELTTSSSETAASVSQTSATIDELKQTAELSNQKAKELSSASQKAADVSSQGKEVTEETIKGMENIKEQMESIAESIIKLSEQSQSIGEIINTVNDLAEQSNILAVNAAIEAVKAGEHGKGFSVVAQEVRSLAEQSKQAIKEIRVILNDIQKATGAAVMSTEQGSKAVDKGINHSLIAEESIMALADNIIESANEAIQIEASSNEQKNRNRAGKPCNKQHKRRNRTKCRKRKTTKRCRQVPK